VKPELVIEVAFTEWTRDGKVRHPTYRGVREDKDAREVVREEPRSRSSARSSSSSSSILVSGVRVSHPSRVIDPASGTTKLDLVRYYDAVADAMLPHVDGRPLTLVHCPQGLSSECRFMKHSKVWAPDAVRRVRIREKTKVGEYLVIDSRAALLSVAQMDVLEIHTWNSRVGRLEEPDRIVIDLDPGPRVPWATTVDAALRVRAALAALGLASFVKSTGGVGLHVVVPLAPERPWTECLDFARAFASLLAGDDPRLFTTSFAVAGREAKILLDYLRNNRTNTSVAAFSTRARPRLPVSVPLAWDELDRRAPPAHDARNVPRRLARLREDPWRAYARTRQRLATAALAAAGARSPPRGEARRRPARSGR
jgi:bifunctional non-homologous end joining protein LigD